MSIINNPDRIGNFTSSNIYKLLTRDRSGKGMGAPGTTYIMERNIERLLGRSIATESDARPLQWGKMCEGLVFQKLPIAHDLKSQETIVHETIPFWAGSVDTLLTDAIGEIKCPSTMKSFFLLVGPLLAGLTGIEAIYAIRDGFEINNIKFPAHPDGEKYYFQSVSNAILAKKKYAEFIVFMPYLSQLPGIREEADFQGINWIKYASDDELPYIHEGGAFKNLTIIRFQPPQKDIDTLTQCVIESGNLLISRPLLTIHDSINGANVVIKEQM